MSAAVVGLRSRYLAAFRGEARWPRQCVRCGETYYRRNLVEVWRFVVVAGRLVHFKIALRLCLKCSQESEGSELLRVSKAPAKMLSRAEWERVGRARAVSLREGRR